MTHLVVFVVTDANQCSGVLDVWEEAGARGATILESIGLARYRCGPRDDLPLMPSLRDLLGGQEYQHRTVFTVVDDDETLQRIIDASKQFVGDFRRPNAGLLFVVPLSMVLGLDKDLGEELPCD